MLCMQLYNYGALQYYIRTVSQSHEPNFNLAVLDFTTEHTYVHTNKYMYIQHILHILHVK